MISEARTVMEEGLLSRSRKKKIDWGGNKMRTQKIKLITKIMAVLHPQD